MKGRPICAMAAVFAGLSGAFCGTSSNVVDIQAGEPLLAPGLGFAETASSDTVTALATSRDGRVYVTGLTRSAVFPKPATVPLQGPTAFVARVSTTAAEYDAVMMISGLDRLSLALDSAGNVYIAGAGFSTGATTRFGLGGASDAIVIKLDASLSTVRYRIVIGGTGDENANAIAVDASGGVYVSGQTSSRDFPVTPGCFQPINRASSSTSFVAAISADGNTLLWSTYLGGSTFDQVRSNAIGQHGLYVAGVTASTDFPVVSGAFQNTPLPSAGIYPEHAFIAELSFRGDALVASTYLSGSGLDDIEGLALGRDGSVTVAGTTSSVDFPVTQGGSLSQNETTGFITRLDSTLQHLVFSEFIGGISARVNAIAVDSTGTNYITGSTQGQLVTVRAVQPEYYAAPCSHFTPSGGGLPLSACNAAFFSVVGNDGDISTSSYLNTYGGENGDATGRAITVGRNGSFFVGGVGVLSFVGASAAFNSGTAFLVDLNTTVTPPLVTSESITNAASFASGLPSPGSLASIFCIGLLLSNLEGVTVTVGGLPAPILAVASVDGHQQINIQVPWNIQSDSAADVVIQQAGTATWFTQLNFRTSAPGIFTVDGRNGAIQHADYSLVSSANPALPGEVVILYATGLGAVSIPVQTGQPTPSSPLSNVLQPVMVSVGDQPAQVLFAGLAPGEIGVYQLNIQLPSNLKSGVQQMFVSLPPVTDEKPPSFAPTSYARSSLPVEIAIR